MRHRLVGVASVLSLVLCAAPSARCQWVHPGPAGGAVTSFASSGSDLYVSIRGGGVFHSRDSGITWTPASTGLTDTNVALLAAFGPIVLAVTDSVGLFRSTDQGNHWSPANNGLPTTSRDLSFAAVGTIIFAGTDDSVYRSTDGALHWSSVSTGLTHEPGSTLVSSGTVLYFSNGYEVARSVDSGAVWVNVSKGLSTSYLINDLQARDSLVFAGTRGGIFRTSDRGRNWEGPDTAGLQIHGQLFGLPRLVLCDTTLFGLTSYGYNQTAIFRSTDNGLDWIRMDTAGSGLDTSVSSPFLNCFGLILLSGDGDGVVRSSDGGVSWSRSNIGIYLYDMGYRVLEPLTYLGNRLIARGDSLYVSTDLGVHWERYDALNGHSINDIALLGRYAFVATDSEGILRSSDNGATWAPLDGMTNVYPVKSLAVGAGVIYAATDKGGIYRSIDSGSTWIQVHTADTWGPEAAVAAAGRNVFALFYNLQGITNHYIYRSSDSGKTWSAMSEPGEYVWLTQLWTNSKFVFVGGSFYLYRSLIDTTNWQGVNRPQTPYTLLVTDSEIFFGASSGAFISWNNADHWDSAGLAKHNISNFLIADGYLFAGTEAGLWRRPLSDFPKPVQKPAGVAVAQADHFDLFPNPANGLVTLHGITPDVQRITVSNVLGVDVLDVPGTNKPGGMSHNSEFTLDLSRLPAGTYFVRIQTEEGSVMRKVIRE